MPMRSLRRNLRSREPLRASAHWVTLGAMIGQEDGTFGSRLFSEVIGIGDNLVDLLDYITRPQNTTDDTVSEGDQSRDTDDQTHEIVERK